eukprot:9450466-Pyramimonas_sp.AAC.1
MSHGCGRPRLRDALLEHGLLIYDGIACSPTRIGKLWRGFDCHSLPQGGGAPARDVLPASVPIPLHTFEWRQQATRKELWDDAGTLNGNAKYSTDEI